MRVFFLEGEHFGCLSRGGNLNGSLQARETMAGLVAVVDHYTIRIHDEGNANRNLELRVQRNGHIEDLARLIREAESEGV